jgi:hypothetical protein
MAWQHKIDTFSDAVLADFETGVNAALAALDALNVDPDNPVMVIDSQESFYDSTAFVWVCYYQQFIVS